MAVRAMTGAAVAAGIVVAAGAGERLGADVPKAFVEVAGSSLVGHAVAALRAADVSPVVVVVPDGWEARTREEVDPDVTIVTGGETRTASVSAGLAALPDDADVVAVHDAARPLVPVAVVADAVAAVRDDVLAAGPGMPVADTLKRVDVDGTVEATIDRHRLVGIQTPQVFRREALQAGHDAADADGRAATDDLALVEELVAAGRLQGRVVATLGSALGFKVTQPADLLLVSALAAVRTSLDSGDST